MKLLAVLAAALAVPALVGPAPFSSGDGPNGRAPFIERHLAEVNVKRFGAAGDGVTNDTAAIQKAVDAIGAAGGGTIYFPKGTYLVSNGNPRAVSWDNRAAIWIRFNNVHLKGAGVNATTLRLADGANAHIVKFGQREGRTIAVVNGSVRGLRLDGNRVSQKMPSERVNHWHGIDVASGARRIVLANLFITNTQYYGIGMQRRSIKDSRIEHVVIENSGADGIDWKNDDGLGVGNVVRNITVRNFGLASSSLSVPQAGIDLRSGVYAEKLTVSKMTASDDLVGVRVLPDGDGSSLATPRQPTKLKSVTVLGSKGAKSVGIRIAASNVQASDIEAYSLSDGLRVSRPGVRLSRLNVRGNAGAGVRLTGEPLANTEADAVAIDHLVATGNSYGIVYDSVDDVTVVGADLRHNKRVGHNIVSGSSNIRIVGGSANGNALLMKDKGRGTIIRNVTGAGGRP